MSQGAPTVNSSSYKKPILHSSILVGALLMSGPLLSLVFTMLPVRYIDIQIPEQFGSWANVTIAPLSQGTRWNPQYSGYTEYSSSRFENRSANAFVDAHLVHYENQAQDVELINVNNQLTDEARWPHT